MFTATELIALLEARYRRRFPLHAERPFGQFPPTWRQWFLSMHARADAVTGAPAKDFVAIFAARPLAARPKAPSELGRFPALLRLLVRQQWEPALREERGLRRFAAALSGGLHIVFAMLLLWLAVVAIDAAPKRQNDDGETVLVEYIGVGTPEDTGGGPAQGADETQPPSNANAAAATSPVPPETLSEAASLPETAAAQPSVEPTPEPPTPTPPVAQPLVVSEPRTPPEEEPVFALPPPQARTAQTTVPRALREPELRPSATEIELLEPRPPVRALQHREVARTPTAPELRTRPTEVEMFEPLPTVNARTPTPRAPAPQLRTPALRTAPSEIAMREPAPPAAPGPPTPSTSNASPSREVRTTAIEGGGPTKESSNDGGRPTATPGPRPAPTAAGSGPAPVSRPGGLPSPRRSDDWGDSTQNRPGNSTAGRSDKPGLFNADGSVRVPSGDGKAGGGLPPGTITEDFEKIDRMGTWLKRPPTDYTPGRLERMFVPHESLLEEWVRRNVREVFVPIPGTKKRIVCKVSLLQAGGGCFIDDPNMRDQEAEARKPPDVPFKPDLQEN
ncbi:MAG: hypothetical protein KA144_04325 [Xanthomonadaceae bacterium]|nr:hypothetical protein [Xanthomonadaceae bacterium]